MRYAHPALNFNYKYRLVQLPQGCAHTGFIIHHRIATGPVQANCPELVGMAHQLGETVEVMLMIRLSFGDPNCDVFYRINADGAGP